MKILFLSENYFPNVSGVPVVVKYLAEGLHGLGHNVTIATSCYGNTPREEIIGGVKIYRFDLHKNHFDLYSGEIENYKQFVLGFQCDVIIMECLQCVVTDTLLPYLDEIKAKKILHVHGISGLRLRPLEKKSDLLHSAANTWHWLHSQWFFHRYLPRYLSQFDKILCLSEVDDTIPYCKKFNIKAGILPNAVEDSFIQPSNPVEQPDIRALNKPYFLSVAYYSQIKNQIGILEEFYKTGIKDCAMVFIGPEKNEYYEKVLSANREFEVKYGPRQVLFLTNVERRFIPDIIGNAKLYLVGSTIEQFSIAMIETMAKGIPFVSTNVGNAKMLPGGIIVDNICVMYDKIQLLMQDDRLYKHLGFKGHEYVSEFCIRSKVVKQLEVLMKKLINN